MPLTLRQVLDLDVVRRGSPLVVAGAGRLDVPVRWVHALELTDIGRLLRGGELVLSTGIALPDVGRRAGRLHRLAGARSAWRAWSSSSAAGTRRRCRPRWWPRREARSVPLVELRHEVAFIEITEAVHARIIDELLISRAAATLALGHLLTSQAESLERQAHRTLISAIIERSGHGRRGEAEARARALGVEVAGRELVAVVVRLADAEPPAGGRGRRCRRRRAGSAAGRPPCSGSPRRWRAPAARPGFPRWSGRSTTCGPGALLSLPPGADDDGPLRALAARLASAARRAGRAW